MIKLKKRKPATIVSPPPVLECEPQSLIRKGQKSRSSRAQEITDKPKAVSRDLNLKGTNGTKEKKKSTQPEQSEKL